MSQMTPHYIKLLEQYLSPDSYPKLFELFAKQASIRKLAPGDTVVYQGQSSDALCLVLSGFTEVSMIQEDGRWDLITRCGPGLWYGEIPFMDSGNIHICIEALTDFVEVRLLYNAIHQSKVPAAELYRCLATSLAARVRRMDELVYRQKVISTKQRLLTYLRHMADEKGELTITQEKMAAFLSVDRNKIYRALCDLKNERKITTGYKKVKLL